MATDKQLIYCSALGILLSICGCAYGSMEVTALAKHNEMRTKAGLTPFLWDEDLAEAARNWSRKLMDDHACALKHSSDSDREGGENLYAVGGDSKTDTVLAEKAVEAWYNEVKKYSYPSNEADSWASCSTWSDVGHFTAIMWAETELLGCGSATCAGDKQVVTCHYYPSGNVNTKPLMSREQFDTLMQNDPDAKICSADKPSSLIASTLLLTMIGYLLSDN